MMGFLVIRNDEKSVVAVVAENKGQALTMAYNTDGIDEESDVYELVEEPSNAPFSAMSLNPKLKETQKIMSLAKKRQDVIKDINETEQEIDRLEDLM